MAQLQYELYGVAALPVIWKSWLVGVLIALLWLGFTRFIVTEKTESANAQDEMTLPDVFVTAMFWPLEVMHWIGDKIVPSEND